MHQGWCASPYVLPSARVAQSCNGANHVLHMPAILPGPSCQPQQTYQKPNRLALSKPSVPAVVGQPHLVQLIQLGLHEVIIASLPRVLIPAQGVRGVR